MDIIIHGDGRILPEHFDPDILAAFTQNHQAFRDIFEEYTLPSYEGLPALDDVREKGVDMVPSFGRVWREPRRGALTIRRSNEPF
jgi:hypothetical protein